MSNDFLKQVVDVRPLSYQVPPFPSLYWPVPIYGPQAQYLFDAYDIFLFTLYWTLICVVGVHLVAAGYICVMQYQNWKLIWIAPVVFLVIGGIEAVIAGCCVGGLLGGIYTAGYFRMSTWVPLSWGVINALVLILSSFAMQGGL